MITKEKIEEAAASHYRLARIITEKEYHREVDNAFIAGAAWMQEQDQWISVEDDGTLPELDEDVNRRAAGFSKRVIVLIDGYEHFATYAYSIDDWIYHTYCGYSVPSHWTYIPTKP